MFQLESWFISRGSHTSSLHSLTRAYWFCEDLADVAVLSNLNIQRRFISRRFSLDFSKIETTQATVQTLDLAGEIKILPN